jgi:hypothetical protein
LTRRDDTKTDNIRQQKYDNIKIHSDGRSKVREKRIASYLENRGVSLEAFLETAEKTAENTLPKIDRALAESFLDLLFPKTYAEDQSILSPEANTVLEVLRNSDHMAIAPLAYVRDPGNREMTQQLFESADLIAGKNETGANHIVFIVDRSKQAKELGKAWTAFLKEKYPNEPREFNRIHKQIHIFTRDNRLIAEFLPPQVRKVWVEWNEKERVQVSPMFAEDRQVFGNRLKNGERIRDFEKIEGYGTSLLQAALLLIKPEESQLVKMGPNSPNLYVQAAVETLRGLAKSLAELLSAQETEREISAAA